MKNTIKILLGISILLLIIGVASATDIDALKTPDQCQNLKDGCAAFDNHIDRMLYVEKLVMIIKQIGLPILLI